MALTFGVWFVLVALEWLSARNNPDASGSVRTYAIYGIAIFLLSYVFVILLCSFSRYFSPENFQLAHKALAVMKEALAAKSLHPLFHRSAGEAMPLWAAVICVLTVLQLLSREHRRRALSWIPAALIISALFIWISGAWYWLFAQRGGTQVRFFYPFILMGCICMISPALDVWPRIHRWAGSAPMALCFLPAVNMAALLAAGDSPSARWQAITGVSVSVGRGREEVSQAYAFLREVRKGGENPKVYFFPNSMLPQSSCALIGDYEKILRPELTSFAGVHGINWTRGSAIITQKLLNCDYILVAKYKPDSIREYLSARDLQTFEAESLAFESWLSIQGRQSGLEIISDGTHLRLFRIAERSALSQAVHRFVSERKWRPRFHEANSTGK